jgi:hypothetical protein
VRARLSAFHRTLSRFVAAAFILLAAAAAAQSAPVQDAADLPFGSFFRFPAGPRGLEIADSLRAADGRRVRLVGYVVVQDVPVRGRFLLAPRPVRLSEHADGEADDLPSSTVTVLLPVAYAERIVAHREGRVSVTGRLEVGRAEDADGRVSWVRLQLDADGVTDGSPTDAANPDGAADIAEAPADRQR